MAARRCQSFGYARSKARRAVRIPRPVGATDPRGTDPIAGRVGPDDFLATIYRHLGFDYEHITIPNFAGRPIPILSEGAPISELGKAAVSSGPSAASGALGHLRNHG